MNEWKNTMLISPSRVKQSAAVNLNTDESVIGAAIRTAQQVYMVDVVGTELVEALQQKVYNKIKGLPDGIDDMDNAPYKVLLEEYMTPALISKTVSETALRITYKIRNMGLVQNEDTNVYKTSLSEVKYIRNNEETQYNHYLNRMVEYLCANKEAIKESHFDCTCQPRKKYANINLWLGGNK